MNNLEIIVAVDKNNAIGRNGDLLAHLSPDLKRLKSFTVGNAIVMGSKTYMSFPKRPLPDRENIVLTSTPEKYPEVKCFTDIPSFLEYADTLDVPVFVLGGGTIYDQLLPYCSKAHITEILHEFDSPDTFFPDLASTGEWEITKAEDIIDTEKYPFRYVTYERIK